MRALTLKSNYVIHGRETTKQPRAKGVAEDATGNWFVETRTRAAENGTA